MPAGITLLTGTEQGGVVTELVEVQAAEELQCGLAFREAVLRPEPLECLSREPVLEEPEPDP